MLLIIECENEDNMHKTLKLCQNRLEKMPNIFPLHEKFQFMKNENEHRPIALIDR